MASGGTGSATRRSTGCPSCAILKVQSSSPQRRTATAVPVLRRVPFSLALGGQDQGARGARPGLAGVIHRLPLLAQDAQDEGIPVAALAEGVLAQPALRAEAHLLVHAQGPLVVL